MSVKVLDRTQAQMKAAITEVGQRTLDFYAAAFSATPDKNGDLIDPHALDAWLKSFYKIGKPLPISFAHGAIRTDTDPFAIIGHAPADAQHVWIDDYGLRVKALLDMENPTARQVASLIDNGVLGGASVAYMAEREKRLPDGSARITQMSVIEAGPCLEPANADAVVLGLKTAERLVAELAADTRKVKEDAEREAKILEIGRSLKAMLNESVLNESVTTSSADEGGDEVEGVAPATPKGAEPVTVGPPNATVTWTKATDNSGWDGNKAMTACTGAADYRAICAAEHTTGVPDERQHWAFPHHFLAAAGRAKGPNEGGVTAGLQNVKKAQNITDAERASGLAHLQDHMKEINPDYEPPKTQGSEAKMEGLVTDFVTDQVLIPELKHGAAPGYIQTAHDALVRGGAKCATAEAATKNDSDDVQAWLRRMRHIKLSVT